MHSNETDGSRANPQAGAWKIEFGGEEIYLREFVGARYLAWLLANPDRRFHVSDLRGLAVRRERQDPEALEADDLERMRKSVGNALRRAIERIRQHWPVLGAHLSRSVLTGTYCSYEPDWMSMTETPAAGDASPFRPAIGGDR